MINLGNKGACSIYLGNKEISSVYFGNTLVWTSIGNWFIASLNDENPLKFKINRSSEYYYANNNERYSIKTRLVDLSNMFCDCSNLLSLENISNWNTSNVTNMKDMFYNCTALTSLNLSGWRVSKATDMSSMFYKCSSLTSLNLSGWDISNATDISSMFYKCSSLTSLELPNWNVSNATSMTNLFSNCTSLTSLNLSGWDTSNITRMSYTFFLCSALVSLNISNWNFSKVTDAFQIFGNCTSLTTIIGPISGLNITLDITYSPLTHDSAMVFINGLSEVTSTQRIYFKKSTYETLTQEEIAIATSKGWTVSKSSR